MRTIPWNQPFVRIGIEMETLKNKILKTCSYSLGQKNDFLKKVDK
jgi:hypothetical protein